MEKSRDFVAEYIALREKIKKDEQTVSALEVVILNSYRDDKRIKIYAGRKKITLTDVCYNRLETLGVETTVVETRKKDFNDFDKDLQVLIIGNQENFTETISKESIRIVDAEGAK